MEKSQGGNLAVRRCWHASGCVRTKPSANALVAWPPPWASGTSRIEDVDEPSGEPKPPIASLLKSTSNAATGLPRSTMKSWVWQVAFATAALAGVQYLLTQNCTHIANAHELPRVYRLLNELGLSGMLICTPIEFLGGN